MANLADQALGCTISVGFSVRLRAPSDGPRGDTDMAMEIGEGLIREALLLLKTAAEAEGFEVEIKPTQMIVY